MYPPFVKLRKELMSGRELVIPSGELKTSCASGYRDIKYRFKRVKCYILYTYRETQDTGTG